MQDGKLASIRRPLRCEMSFLEDNQTTLSNAMTCIARWGASLLIIMAIAALSGCDSSSKSDFITSADSRFFPSVPPLLQREPASCSALDQKRFVHEVMLDSYFWYDTIPQSVRYNDFASPEALVEFLRYAPRDRFSYIVSAKEHDDYFNNGKAIGLGASMRFAGPGLVMVQYVHSDSPAADAGLERGDQVLTINGKTVEEITSLGEWGGIFGPDEPGIDVVFGIRKPDGTEHELRMSKAIFNVRPVFQSRVIDHEGIKVGYLILNSFIEPSRAELASAFMEFRLAGVDEMVLDLRYNPGGMVTLAAALGGYLYRGAADTDPFVLGEHNERYASLNWQIPFEKHEDDLALSRVFVLTGRESCSASEVMINSLRPYMSVVTVGGTTCGKPVGMYGYSFCDQHFAPIEFEVKNARREGGYFDGIVPDCPVHDDLAQPLGELSENLLGEALHYISSNSCSSQARAASILHETDLPTILKGFRRLTGVL